MIALLPMKKNSERIPGKNVKLLNGKPLFFYIADKLKETGLFDKLVINTDGARISSLSRKRYGNWVEIIERPKSLIGGNISMNWVIAHDISIIGEENDYFQTHSTNPLLTRETISSGAQLYESKNFNLKWDSIFSVNVLQVRLYDKKIKPLNHNINVLGRTQDLEEIYEENSNFYIFSGKSFKKTQQRIGIKPYAYRMDRRSMESLDIDEPSDWKFLEQLMQIGAVL